MSVLTDLYSSDEIVSALKLDLNSQADVLPQPQQEYANEVVSNLDEKPIKPVTTETEWAAVNKRESDKLMQDEEGFFERVVEQAAIQGKSPREVSGIAQAMAVLKSEAEARGIAHAAAISAERNRLALADIMNPQNAQMDEYIKRHDQLANEKMAIREDFINDLENEVAKLGFGRAALNFAKELIPGVRPYAYSSALKSSAIGTGKVKSWIGSADRLRVFRNTIGNFENDDTVGGMQYSKILKEMKENMLKEGTDLYTIRDLFRAVQDFDPGEETFYDTVDYGAAVYMLQRSVRV